MSSSSQDKKLPKPEPASDRTSSVDSAAFFEAGDGYDDYDDFGANQKGNSSSSSDNKTKKRQDGGSGKSGNIYSAKHVRAKEAQRKGK